MSTETTALTTATEVGVRRKRNCEERHLEPEVKTAEENAPSETVQQEESASDWLLMVCVFLCNVLNGIAQSAYSVLYIPLTDMFQSTRAAVGWIPSFEFALGMFLGNTAFTLYAVLVAVLRSSIIIIIIIIM